jgi:hypothetical protein
MKLTGLNFEGRKEILDLSQPFAGINVKKIETYSSVKKRTRSGKPVGFQPGDKPLFLCACRGAASLFRFTRLGEGTSLSRIGMAGEAGPLPKAAIAVI